MPELDGVGATKQIRALPEPKSRIPIVAMTADAMSGSRAEYLAAGMDDYISKPIRPDALMAILERLAGSKKIARRDADKPASSLESRGLPVLDSSRLAAITGVLNGDQLRDFQALYLQDIQNYMAEINASAASGDLAAIARTAHIIVSTAGNVGALETSARARQLEETCKRGEDDKVSSLVEALNSAAAAASRAIQAQMNAASSTAADKLSA